MTMFPGAGARVPCKYAPGKRKTRPRTRVNGKLMYLSRYLWEQRNGPIPPGFYICHTCDDPQCIEFTHFFLGTHADNMADMKAKDRGRGGHTGKTHCAKGHEFTPENTYVTINYNGRMRKACRKCRSAVVQANKRRKRVSRSKR